MLIGVISDTHLANVSKEFMSLIEARFSKCDIIVHAGDFTNPAVYFYLHKVTAGNLMAVYGNMVPPELRGLLQKKIVFEEFGLKIGLIHGWGAPQDLEERIQRVFRDDNVDCIIYGHSHNSANHRIDNVLFFNPGSPTDRYYAKRASIGYVTIQDHEIFGEITSI